MVCNHRAGRAAQARIRLMSQQHTIRPAAAENQPDIKQLIRDAGINPLGLHWSRFLIAVDSSQTIIGCGQVKAHRDGSHELASVAVAREWRKQGIAGQIIQALQQEHGPPLWLTCMDRLVPFYRPFGFGSVETTEDMPPYFRRASRFFNLYLVLSRGKGKLAVMVWQGSG